MQLKKTALALHGEAEEAEGIITVLDEWDEPLGGADPEAELERLEEIVESHVSSSLSAGKALREIRNKKLYHLRGCKDFKEYLERHSGLSHAHAYRCIYVAGVTDEVPAARNLKPSIIATLYAMPIANARPILERAAAEHLRVEDVCALRQQTQDEDREKDDHCDSADDSHDEDGEAGDHDADDHDHVEDGVGPRLPIGEYLDTSNLPEGIRSKVKRPWDLGTDIHIALAKSAKTIVQLEDQLPKLNHSELVEVGAYLDCLQIQAEALVGSLRSLASGRGAA
jgi:hypothetical protein